MTFARPSINRVRLSDYLGKPVALRFVSLEQNIPVTYPDGTKATNSAVKADLMTIRDSRGVREGETLIFPRVVQEVVQRNAGEWVIGILSEHTPESGDEDRAYMVLEDPNDDQFAALAQAFETALSA
jgi:hypothetical protein